MTIDRSLKLIITFAVSLVLGSCSPSAAPTPTRPSLGGHDLNVKFLYDSVHGLTATGDTAVLTMLTDESPFHLSAGTDDGNIGAFTWSVDNDSDKPVHWVFVHPVTSVIAAASGRYYLTNFYPSIITPHDSFIATNSLKVSVFKN